MEIKEVKGYIFSSNEVIWSCIFFWYWFLIRFDCMIMVASDSFQLCKSDFFYSLILEISKPTSLAFAIDTFLSLFLLTHRRQHLSQQKHDTQTRVSWRSTQLHHRHMSHHAPYVEKLSTLASHLRHNLLGRPLIEPSTILLYISRFNYENVWIYGRPWGGVWELFSTQYLKISILSLL